jgi:hypothetical protein
MLIRKSQFELFSTQEVQKFEDWMVSHLQKFFPSQCEPLGEGELRAFIQLGIVRAAHYEIREKREVCRFIDLMMVFGQDFDSSEQTSWAAEILSRPGDSGMKMRALLFAAKRSLESD